MIQRVRQGTPAVIESMFEDQNGAGLAPAGPVTVTVTRADGTAVLTDAATNIDTLSPGRVTRLLTVAHTANLDYFTATWTDAASGATTTSYVDIAGGFYFSIAEARDADKGLQDVVKYSDDVIALARQRVENECELITLQAFVPRFRAVELDTNHLYRSVWGRYDQPHLDMIQLPDPNVRRIRSVSIDGIDFTTDEVADLTIDGYGLVRSMHNRRAFRGISNVIKVAYEYGESAPPADIKDVAFLHLRVVLNAKRSGIPERATTFTQGQGGTFTVATPGTAGFETGIYDVDQVYLRHRRRAIPAIA